MSGSPTPQGSSGYSIRVAGHLDDHWSPWFGGLTLTPEHDGATSLTGVVADQAQLHGLLAKIRDLGMTLISVQVIDHPNSINPSPASKNAPSPPSPRSTSPNGAPTWVRPPAPPTGRTPTPS